MKWDAEFQISGQPGLQGFETSGFPLTWSYSTGVDCRFPGVVQLAPLLTSVDLSASQSSAANAKRIVFSEGISTDTAELAVIANGARPTTIRLDTRVAVSTASTAAYGAAITDLITTKAANGTQEIAVALGSTAYQVITAFAAGGFTTSANNESYKYRIWCKGPSFEADGMVLGLGFGTGSTENFVGQNVLTGTVTMDASAWEQRVIMGGSNITFTGAALDGPFFIIGTTAGPFRYNNEHFVFVPMLPSMLNSPSANACKNMRFWEKLGTIIPLEVETRNSVGLDGASVGPETYPTNNSPVQGRVTAEGYSLQWGLWAIYNPFADATYLCWVRPRLGGDITLSRGQAAIFPMNKLTDGVDCEAIEYAGTKGSVQNPTWYVGQDGNVAWQIEGRNQLHWQDTACTYQSSGSIYLTEVMRDPEKDKVVKAIGVRTAGCSSTETITFNLNWTDKFGVSQTTALTTINSNGMHIIHIPQEKQMATEAFQISIDFARGGTSTNTPRIIRWGRSEVKLAWTEIPLKDKNGRGME